MTTHLGIKNIEMPLDSDGRSMHLGLNKDEGTALYIKWIVANRMIIVGDYDRCNTVAECLSNVKRIKSKRHFLTFTGLYNDIPVSVVCGGMGMSITDFTIREAREIVEGPMAIVRFGSCGVVDNDVDVGDIIVPESSIMVQQNFFDDSGPFLLSKPAFADKELLKIIIDELNATSSKYFKVATGGMVASTDSFYASQGKSYK